MKHVFAVDSLEFSPDDNFLASGSNDKRIIIWSVENEKKVTEFQCNGPSWFISFYPSGEYLATCDLVDVNIWRVKRGDILVNVLHYNTVGVIMFSPDGKYLATKKSDLFGNVIVLWDVASLSKIREFMHTDLLIAMSFTPDGKYLASGMQNDAVIWNLSQHVIARLRLDGHVNTIAFSSDGRYLTIGERRNTVIYDWRRRKIVARIPSGNAAMEIAWFKRFIARISL